MQVYWPAMQQGAVDFVVSKPEGLRRVQVKTATWNRSAGKHHYLQCRTRLTNKYQTAKPFELYDEFVVVSARYLWVIPANLIHSSNLCLAGTKPGYDDSEWMSFREDR